ncbi:hypothetical protein GCM10010466_07240 [Planomonospora alba]|uniref:ATP-binding protein n=1 Tax=Planomonospora alba TaxID=161354 RepID=A0ABP6MLR6_9ACTN
MTESVRIGTRVTPEEAASLPASLARHLDGDEQLLGLFSTRLLKPALSHIAVSDRRVFGVDRSSMGSGGPTMALTASDIAACDVRKGGFGRPNVLSVRLRDGSTVDLGDIPPGDNAVLRRMIRDVSARAAPTRTRRFNSPPGWPPVPADWTPPPGWEPDPAWPPPPPDWEFWTETVSTVPVSSPVAVTATAEMEETAVTARGPGVEVKVPAVPSDIPLRAGSFSEGVDPNSLCPSFTLSSITLQSVSIGESTMSTWREQVPTSGSVELPPDPRALEGLGRNHSLETAVADLVDNSIDAGASQVLIRFVRVEGRLRALYVVDNGHGIPASKIDSAMTVGGRREYGTGDLGKFGLGLKAASFSQARSLTVISKALGSSAVGRRWLLDENRKGFHCDTVPTDFAEDEFSRDWGVEETSTGTVIRWDGVTGFPATDDQSRVERFISHTIGLLRSHLGLVFHRILEAGKAEISIDVEDVEADGPGPRIPVEALNPFGYTRSGRTGYPKELRARSGDVELAFKCYIWTPRSNLPQFKLPEGPEKRQGIYFYRRDRLLQAGGGWHGVHQTDRRLQLARVAVEIDDDIVGLFTMNPEKSRVNVGPQFTRLAEQAIAEDGTTFADYLKAAEQVFRESRKRSNERRKMAPLGKGIAPELRKAIEREIPFAEDEDPIDIRWKRFPDASFFEVDRERRTLWLNERYRPDTKGERRSVNDAPLLKALLYLVVEDLFRGEYHGVRDKDNIELYQEILTAAARSEQA